MLIKLTDFLLAKRRKRLLAIADLLTYLRLACVPIIGISLFRGLESISWIILLIAGTTDILDGWFARRAGGGTTKGAIMDPLADKLIIAIPLIWLSIQGIIPYWAFSVILSREVIVTVWRGKQKTGAPALLLGKIKTVLQFVSIFILISPPSIIIRANIYKLNLISFGIFLFWISFILTIMSAAEYFIRREGNHLTRN